MTEPCFRHSLLALPAIRACNRITLSILDKGSGNYSARSSVDKDGSQVVWNGKHYQSERRTSLMVQEGKILGNFQFI